MLVAAFGRKPSILLASSFCVGQGEMGHALTAYCSAERELANSVVGVAYYLPCKR
jgi:hypothetical protein